MKKFLRTYGIVFVGSLLFSLAFSAFFEVNQVGMAGMTGLGQVINVFLPQISVGVIVFVLNVPIFLVGWKLLGFHLLASSLFSMFVTSAAMDVFTRMGGFSAMDPMLASLCGGALMGLGLGMVFSQGATTGGTDIIGRLLKLKFPWLPLGKLVLVPDLAALVLVAIAFGRLEAALYGAVAMFVSSQVTDTVLYGLDSSKVAYIISDHPDQIARFIFDELEHSVTYLDGEGGFSGAKKKVILCAFKQREIVDLKSAVQQADPDAFMIVTPAHEVLGEGFRSYHQEL